MHISNTNYLSSFSSLDNYSFCIHHIENVFLILILLTFSDNYSLCIYQVVLYSALNIGFLILTFLPGRKTSSYIVLIAYKVKKLLFCVKYYYSITVE